MGLKSWLLVGEGLQVEDRGGALHLTKKQPVGMDKVALLFGFSFDNLIFILYCLWFFFSSDGI